MKLKFLFISLIICLQACKVNKVPKEKLSQFPSDGASATYNIEDQNLIFNFRNNLLSPVRFHIHSDDTLILNYFKNNNPVVIGSEKDSSFRLLLPRNYDPVITFSSALGDPNRKVNLDNVSLPVKKNTPVSIIQGYNSSFSHNNDYSRYAIDFNIKENDTIYAATKGIVIGVIRDYRHGGLSKKWKGYDNFITIFDPDSGLYTQYVHLVHLGSLVSIGDKVNAGDPIGLSGKTGFADEAHLHFNTLIPTTEGSLISVPVKFIEGYKGADLQKGQKVIRP